jgi:hypothetical protein
LSHLARSFTQQRTSVRISARLLCSPSGKILAVVRGGWPCEGRGLPRRGRERHSKYSGEFCTGVGVACQRPGTQRSREAFRVFAERGFTGHGHARSLRRVWNGSVLHPTKRNTGARWGPRCWRSRDRSCTASPGSGRAPAKLAREVYFFDVRFFLSKKCRLFVFNTLTFVNQRTRETGIFAAHLSCSEHVNVREPKVYEQQPSYG